MPGVVGKTTITRYLGTPIPKPIAGPWYQGRATGQHLHIQQMYVTASGINSRALSCISEGTLFYSNFSQLQHGLKTLSTELLIQTYF